MAIAARTVIDVLRLSTDYLAQHGSASPRLDAELLCAYAWQLRRLDLYLQHDRPLKEPELEAARALVRRRAGGEPVAYITGVREFYNRPFMVDPAVLIPRPETETLVELAIRVLRERAPDGGGASVADLGTGSGCIAVTLALELPSIEVVAVDAGEAALEVARANAAEHAVTARVTFLHGDWAGSLERPVDLVVSNPPYVTTAELAAAARDVRDFEPHAALDGGADGLDAYRALLESLDGHVGSGAQLLLEIDPRRAAAVAELISDAFPGSAVTAHPDLTGRDRVIEARIP